MANSSWARGAACAWSACIFASAAVRGKPAGHVLRTTGPNHILVHAGVFGVLAGLLVLSFTNHKHLAAALACAGLLGLGTEAYECLAFGSAMEWMDVLTDACGVVLGAALTMEMRQKTDPLGRG